MADRRLTKDQAELLGEVVSQGSLLMRDLPDCSGAAELEAQGLVEIVLGIVTPTDKGERLNHDARPIHHACDICGKACRTQAAAQKCAAKHVPAAKKTRSKKRKRTHRCLSCKAEHDSLDEAKACLDSHW